LVRPAKTWQDFCSQHVDARDTLFMVQVGREPADFKPIASVEPGAYEIWVRDEAGAFRVIYVAKFEHAVYVLHAFQKKTRKTSQADLELAASRYKMIGEEP